ncbi:MAG: polyprenyl synthetase family protein [Gammaproteobacteria bacterium]|nr:polyprenyl synthetase family protein [Gammaproteobacteria bacterium]MDD9894189.1 polyprenyl synthetase family protein [Gammaproteobacteria bacterium]MDD9958556.1 polyprenyl synthetase family protein [Gammaproteobacteria bacterium]
MYQDIRAVVESDFLAVNEFIIKQLYSEVTLVESIGHYIVEAGGKRMRPVLTLLAARCCDIESQRHIEMAAVIEFIHTATLLHDDVVDMSTLRRGRPTVNKEWNNPSSVLVGDFIYSRAFQILVQIGNMRIMEIIADTTNKIAEGEVLQLIAKNNPEFSEANYLQVIESKTAILFQAAAQCGALLANAESSTEQALKEFGMRVGTAFQLVDDVLDYAGDTTDLGKNIGDDLAEGKPTLPLICALDKADSTQRQLIQEALRIDQLPKDMLQNVIEIVRNSGGLEYTQNLARSHAQAAEKCLDEIPDSEFRSALYAMVDFAVNRRS